MLTEYSNRSVTMSNAKLIERYDLHYLGGGSDKVYICTLQAREETVHGVKKTLYTAIAYYGRRGNSLSKNVLGAYTELAPAHKEMVKQMNTKKKKSYNEVGHYVDPDAKATATGALGNAVLTLLRETYPVNSRIESPTGKQGNVYEITDKGTLVVHLDGEEDLRDIPFGKYGMLKVVSNG